VLAEREREREATSVALDFLWLEITGHVTCNGLSAMQRISPLALMEHRNPSDKQDTISHTL